MYEQQYGQDIGMHSPTCKRSVMQESSDRVARLNPGQNRVGCISDNQSYLSIIDNNHYQDGRIPAPSPWTGKRKMIYHDVYTTEWCNLTPNCGVR